MVLADSFYYQPVQIDTINTRVNADLFAKEGDANGRGMVVQITENGIIKDTTGITLRLQWSNISVGVSGFTDFEVVDATKGLYKLIYPTSMLHRGRVEAFIRITDNGILSGTRNFLIPVERMVGSDETIEASDDFSALQTALIQLDAWNVTIGGKVDTWEADMEATKQVYIDTLTAAEAAYPQELVSLQGQLAETKSRTMTNKVYLKDYGLLGDFTFRTISSVFPSVTLAQVQALDSTATLSNSADWYILQKLIKESTDGTTIVVDGRYVVDKKLTISRSYINFEGLDDIQYNLSSSSCYIIKTISTTEPLFHLYNTHDSNYIRDFVFDNLQLIGYVNRSTGEKGGDAFLIDGHVMSFTVNRCRVNEFGGNGIYHYRGHFIYIDVDHTSFYFCCENGVYVKHRDQYQLNAMALNKVDAIECGFTWNGSAFVLPTVFSEERGHGLNISGVAVTVTNGDTSGSGCGVLINRGAVMGLSITGRYFEQSTMWDIYVMDRTGAMPVNALVVYPNMHVGAVEDLVKFEQPEYYNRSVIGEGIKNLETEKADFSAVKDYRNEPHPAVELRYNGASKTHVMRKNANSNAMDIVSFIKLGNLRKSYRLKYDFEYVGGTTFDAYGLINFSYSENNPVTNYINRTSKVGNAAKILSVTSLAGVFTINFDRAIQFSGWNKLIIARSYEKTNGYSLKHAATLYGGEKFIINSGSVTFLSDTSIQITGSYTSITTDFELVCVNKTDALDGFTFFTNKLGMGSVAGSKEVYFSIHTKDFPFLNFDLNNVRINFLVNTGLLNTGQDLHIKNLVFEEVLFPLIDKTTLWNDTYQADLVIKDSISKRLIKWTGSKWVYLDGEADVV